jgi:hypothetical protein
MLFRDETGSAAQRRHAQHHDPGEGGTCCFLMLLHDGLGDARKRFDSVIRP